MTNMSDNMKYIARHVSRKEILRKIIDEAETLAKVARELCDTESKEAWKALSNADTMLAGTFDILDVKNGYSPDELLFTGRSSPFLINDWANALREAENHD